MPDGPGPLLSLREAVIAFFDGNVQPVVSAPGERALDENPMRACLYQKALSKRNRLTQDLHVLDSYQSRLSQREPDRLQESILLPFLPPLRPSPELLFRSIYHFRVYDSKAMMPRQRRDYGGTDPIQDLLGSPWKLDLRADERFGTL